MRPDALHGRVRGLRIGQAAEPGTEVDAGQAMRLLVLADGSRRAVDGAIAAAAAPGATPADKAAGEEVARCARVLTAAAGPFDALVVELRASLSSGRQARIYGRQAAALEAFAVCAARAAGAAGTSGGLLGAIVGTAGPAAAALLVAR